MNKINNISLNNEDKPWSIVRGKIIVKMSLLEKSNIEDETKLKVVNEKIIHMSGKEFRSSIEDDITNGIKHTVKIVNEKPEKFQINGIYILANGKRAWIYTEK